MSPHPWLHPIERSHRNADVTLLDCWGVIHTITSDTHHIVNILASLSNLKFLGGSLTMPYSETVPCSRQRGESQNSPFLPNLKLTVSKFFLSAFLSKWGCNISRLFRSTLYVAHTVAHIVEFRPSQSARSYWSS